MDKLKRTENFFVEGSGKAHVLGENGKYSLIHLQDMSIELTAKREDIFGGESIFSLYNFSTEKGCNVKFTNASMSMEALSVSQGIDMDKKAVVFKTETLTVGDAGEIVISEESILADSLLVFKDNATVPATIADGVISVDAALAGEKVEVFYRYEITDNAVGASVLTTSVPGYVTIYHESKPLKQKNGRIIKILTTIYKARCDGSLKLDFKHKNAFAPELSFSAVDPEREDGKFVTVSVMDVTDKA